MRNCIAALSACYSFPAEVISHTVWADFRVPLNLGMLQETLADTGFEVNHETGLCFSLEVC
jgi:transposase-like protein